MNGDFILGQLRLALTAFIAYAGGRGWFTPADSTLALAMLTSLGPLLAPWLLSVYSNLGTKRVPKESISIVPIKSEDAIGNDHVQVSGNATGDVPYAFTGKVIGAFLLALLLFMPSPSFAQPKVPVLAPGQGCDPLVIFKGLTPINFISRMKGCLDDDLDNAILDAQSVPPDYGAQACLLPLKTLRGGLQKGGVLTGFQAYRRAKFMGLLSGCLNYVNSTVALP